jgi:hypothetical protein
MTFAACYRKVEKNRRPRDYRNRRHVAVFRGKTPDAVAANLQLTRPRPPRQIISRVAHWLAWEDVGVSGLPVPSNPLTPGRSQMSHVLCKVLQKAYRSTTLA